MSSEPLSNPENKIMSCRQRGYYWRLIARECGDLVKLRSCIHMLAQEIQMHIEQAEENGVFAPESSPASQMAIWMHQGDQDSLSSAIDALVADLEAWRLAYREQDQWPPQKFEAQDVARAYLGYDPNRALDDIEDEL